MRKIDMHNKKSPRTMALLLAVVLMLLPFFVHAGFEADTKAALEGDSVNYVSFAPGAALGEIEVIKKTVDTADYFGVKGIDGATDIYFDGDKVVCSLGDITADSVKGQTGTYDSGFSLEYKYIISDSASGEAVADEDALTAADTETEAEANQYIISYVKLVLDADAADIKVGEDNYTAAEFNAKSAYMPYAVYKLNKKAFINAATVQEPGTWKKASDNIVVALNSEYTADDIHLGCIKMAFVPAEDGKTDDYYIENASWTTYSNSTTVSSLSLTDGSYKVCVGYFNNQDNLVKSKVVDTVKLDYNSSTDYTVWLQSEDEDGAWADEQEPQTAGAANSFTIKWESGKSYRLAVSADDGAGSGIASVLFDGASGDSDDSGYYKTITRTTTGLGVKITDNAGNESVSVVTFDIDTDAPSVESLEVSEKNGAISGAPQKTYKNPVISYKVKDDRALKDIKLYYSASAVGPFVPLSSMALSGTEKTGSFNVYDEIAEGQCYVKAVVTDAVGRTTDTVINFKHDSTSPEIKNIQYTYSMKDGTGEFSAWAPWNEDGEKRVINTNLIGKGIIKYAITFEVEDDYAGVKAVRNIGTGTLETIEDNSYRIIFNENSAVAGLGIETEDKLGNTDRLFISSEGFTQVEGGIEILSNTVTLCEKDNPDKLVNLASAKLTTSKKYLLKLRATSEYALASARLDAVDESGNNTTLNAELENQDYNAATGMYTAAFVFDMPGKDINTLLKNCRIVVSDTKDSTPQIATKTILDILYDISSPMLTETNADTKWHKDFELRYTIKSGNTLAEAELKTVGYAITNSFNNSEGSRNVDKVTYTGTVEIPESKTIAGTKIEFDAVDSVGNKIYRAQKSNIVTVKVDKHAPEIKDVLFNGKELSEIPYEKAPKLRVIATDNLSIMAIYANIKYPDGTERKQQAVIDEESTGIERYAEFSIEKIDGNVLEGKYEIDVYAEDMSGRKSGTKTYNIIIDKTAPTVTAAITSGRASNKTKNPYYYRSNVELSFTYTDVCIDKVTVTDNGVTVKDISWTPVEDIENTYKAKLTVSKEEFHKIVISAVDKAGNRSNKKTLKFVVDKTAPSISARINGVTYTDMTGLDMSFSPANVVFSVSDMSVDGADNYIKITKELPDGKTFKGKYVKTANTELNLSEEAEYTINIYSIDKAQNKSRVKTVRLRVDAAAPELVINGIGNGQTSADGVSVAFVMREAYWADASGSVDIYSKAGDGREEQLLKTITLTPAAYETSVSELLTETGVYRFEFKAADKAGHTANEIKSLTIDRDAPVITRTGVNDYDKVSDNITYNASVDDVFYTSKTISLKATRTDIDGKVSDVDLGAYSASANPTVINKVFAQDGIYDIELEAKDVAGNTSTDKIHFVVDKTAPSLDDIAGYDGKVLSQFVWDKDVDSIVSDLTVCDVRMYLNGKEYDGMSVVEDGSYILKIVATDELGHETEKEISFELDTKAPNIIVTGVEDGQVQEDAYDINVSLQLDEDTLDSVILDGETVTVANNTCTINVSDKGKHTLEIKAVDVAGNEAQDTITFTVGSKTPVVLIIVICACAVALGIVAIIIIRKRKNK